MTDADRPCEHVWITNDGRGGLPNFKYLFLHRTMRIQCAICTIKIWTDPQQWRNLPPERKQQ